jgi:hypothetical protein
VNERGPDDVRRLTRPARSASDTLLHGGVNEYQVEEPGRARPSGRITGNAYNDALHGDGVPLGHDGGVRGCRIDDSHRRDKSHHSS